jgi:hypothetical protein
MAKAKKGADGTTWAESRARELLLADLRAGAIPLKMSEMHAKDVYQTRPQYQNFPYDDFRGYINRLRKFVAKERDNAATDEMAFEHHRKICPPSTHNHRGEPHWVGSAAEAFLNEDIDAGFHELMPPCELHLTREEYMVYPLKVFRKRIDQNLQTRKFHAYLESKKRSGSK